MTALIPAAQYLRMSTEHQQFSLANQAAAIAQYAEQNRFVVVRTYTDPGRSGLRIRNRPGLTALLQDVVHGSKEFKAILVYDVSRWGRFQDTDEAAHYEFLCRRSGIPVHYCAEQFTNDLALPSVILKSLKRMMAAEYSRELSARTYVGLRRAAQEGFRLGSTPGYGFRRMLFSADGNPKQILRDGEEKSLATDRVRLVLGPPEEVRVVRLIYRMLLKDRLRPSEIMRELSQRGITFYGRSWTFYGVKHVLTHPKYCGLQVWGRTETKLKTSPKRVAEEQWITAAARGPKIVDERTFARAQQVYHDRTDQKSDEELLEALRRLWLKNGHLTEYMIDTSQLTPSVNTYRRRFGRLSRVYQLIRYRQPKSRILQKAIRSRRDSSKQRRRLIRLLQSMFPGIVTRGHYDGYVHCPEAGLDVAVLVCRSLRIRRQTEWSISPRRDQNNTVTLLCLLNESNDRFQSYYVFPRLRVRHGCRIYRDSHLLSEGKKIRSLRDFYRAVIDAHRQLPASDQVRQQEILIGVPQIARYLGQSVGVVRRLIRQGMPVTRQARCPTAIPEEITEWVQRNGTAWNPARDRFGRYLPGGVQVPVP
jgi:DNA invertase Pin-like site-specific DNA recombinase